MSIPHGVTNMLSGRSTGMSRHGATHDASRRGPPQAVSVSLRGPLWKPSSTQLAGELEAIAGSPSIRSSASFPTRPARTAVGERPSASRTGSGSPATRGAGPALEASARSRGRARRARRTAPARRRPAPRRRRRRAPDAAPGPRVWATAAPRRRAAPGRRRRSRACASPRRRRRAGGAAARRRPAARTGRRPCPR